MSIGSSTSSILQQLPSSYLTKLANGSSSDAASQLKSLLTTGTDQNGNSLESILKSADTSSQDPLLENIDSTDDASSLFQQPSQDLTTYNALGSLGSADASSNTLNLLG